MLPFRLFLLLCLFSIPNLSHAQDLLWVERPPFKRTIIQPGDTIMVKFHGDDFTYGHYFAGARGDYLHVRGDSIAVKEISELWVRRSKVARYWLGMMAINGFSVALFTTLGALANIPPSSWTSREGIVVGSAILGGLGFAKLMIRLRWRRYKSKRGRWRFRIYPPIENSVGQRR